MYFDPRMVRSASHTPTVGVVYLIATRAGKGLHFTLGNEPIALNTS